MEGRSALSAHRLLLVAVRWTPGMSSGLLWNLRAGDFNCSLALCLKATATFWSYCCRGGWSGGLLFLQVLTLHKHRRHKGGTVRCVRLLVVIWSLGNCDHARLSSFTENKTKGPKMRPREQIGRSIWINWSEYERFQNVQRQSSKKLICTSRNIHLKRLKLAASHTHSG